MADTGDGLGVTRREAMRVGAGALVALSGTAFGGCEIRIGSGRTAPTRRGPEPEPDPGGGGDTGGTVPVEPGAQVGELWDWRLVGGTRSNTPLRLPRALLDDGWDKFAQQWMEGSIRLFGAVGGLIVHNPCGLMPGEPMRFAQRQMALDAGYQGVGDGHQLIRAFTRLRQASRGPVWVYLGTPEGENLTDAEIDFSVEPFIAAGCNIAIDSAGDELKDSEGWRVAQRLKGRGVKVGYEPRPLRLGPFARDEEMRCFCVQRTNGKGFFRTDPERFQDAARVGMAKNSEIKGGYTLLLTDYDGPGAAQLLADGHDVAINGGTLEKRGWPALRIVTEARDRLRRAEAAKSGGVVGEGTVAPRR